VRVTLKGLKGSVVTYVPQVIAIVDVVVVFTTSRCWKDLTRCSKLPKSGRTKYTAH